jgi:hypothetical protein
MIGTCARFPVLIHTPQMLRCVLQRSLSRIAPRIARTYHASVLPSLISTSSPEFVAKSAAMDELVADLERKTADARLGGGSKAAERMRSKGKKLPRERYVLRVFGWPVIDSRSLDSIFSLTQIHHSLSCLRWPRMMCIQVSTFPGPA